MSECNREWHNCPNQACGISRKCQGQAYGGFEYNYKDTVSHTRDYWRYEFAKAVMQGIYANNIFLDVCNNCARERGVSAEGLIAIISKEQADALLKELEK